MFYIKVTKKGCILLLSLKTENHLSSMNSKHDQDKS